MSESTRMRHRGRQDIDLSTWEWGDDNFDTTGIVGLLMRGAAVRITEVVREEFDAHPPELLLPFQYGDTSDGFRGKPVTDPAMLYVQLPLGGREGDGVVYGVSLEGAIDDVIGGLEGLGAGYVNDPEAQEICRKIAARLRELADKLERATVKADVSHET